MELHDKSKSGEAKKRHNGASIMTSLEKGIVKNLDLSAQWRNAEMIISKV